MSETKLRDLPPKLRDRYGYRRTPWPIVGLALVAIIAVGVFGSWTMYRHANPPVTYDMLTWSSVDDQHTDITFEVRRTATDPVACVLRVEASNTNDVGYAVVQIPAATEYVQKTYSVATISRGFVAEVLGCAPGDTVPNATPPGFAPGTTNPPQPWRAS